jgi:hypothetical protein
VLLRIRVVVIRGKLVNKKGASETEPSRGVSYYLRKELKNLCRTAMHMIFQQLLIK